MSVPHPSDEEAADLVATAERMRTAIGATSWRLVSWFTGMAVATVLYLSGLGIAGRSDPAVLVITGPFVLCVAVLCLALLPGARVFRAGMERRMVRAMLSWGLLFGLAMALGLTLFRAEVAFWLTAAVVAAAPLALGARAEAGSGR